MINNRYEFILLFDVLDGNPNGDPDAGNLPRIDGETAQGLVTDVCIKRKIRNFVSLTKADATGYDIYVKEASILNNTNKRAYEAEGITIVEKKDKQKQPADDVARARAWMCKNFYDIRTFGAVMSTEVNCGQVRGPVQFSFARSIDPIVIGEHSITRMAVTTQKESDDQAGGNRTMGRKFTVPYGLYKACGFINPFLAEQTGFGEEDLELLWQSLINMFEFDRSASHGTMTARALIVFKHDTKLGNAPSDKLLDLINIQRKDGIEVARDFNDYTVTIGEAPEGVTIINKI